MSKISVEVAYALPHKQQILALEVEQGTTALVAVQNSGITRSFPDLDVDAASMGVFGKAIKPATYELQQGDRIEIYRALIADPKEARKKRAEKVKAAKA